MEDDLNYENLMDDVTEAIKKFNLVIFIGAGVSIAQGYPNWNNYIEHLIKYWQGQVLSVSGEKRFGREHHVVFDLISKSSISNKRKVDLVNYELKKVFGEDFEKRRLDFEKGYFKNLLPYSIVNQTVESLASLNAIFITSNYDYEIENHIKRLKNAVVTINDLNEFTKNKNGKLQFGDVLHIHGTPDCDVKYFVSSSADYSKTYLKNRENFENLVTWFKETKPTVLFVGAGLEEDEILSLLCKDSKNYALMKSENTGNQRVDEHYRGVVEGFFSSENHTQIIWYGDEFEKLPLFVKKLVADINEKLGTHDFYNQWNNLLNPSINQEEYNKNLDSISNDFKYLSSVLDKVIENDNNQLDQLMLNALLRSETLTVIKKNFVLAFWRFIVKNIEKLSDNEWDVIYKIIYEGSQNYFIDDVFFVYNYAIDNKISSFTNNNKLNELREIISKDGYIVNSNFNKDKTLLGYWLVSALLIQKLLVQLDNEINLDLEFIKRLIDKIDFSNIHFGEELNTFIKEHRSIIREKNIEIPKKPYRNWISSLEGGFVSQFSYLTQENLVEYDESRVLEILVNAEKEQRGSSFLEEKTINETENFFITVLKESNEISKKVSDLLKNHIDDLYPKYKRLYVKIISFPEIEENLRKIVREKYLKRFNKESFDSNDRKFFEYHIKQQNTDIDIFEKLLSINVNELSTPKGDNKQLDILHFINSEMGSYFQCLISLFINHSSYRDVIIQIINSVTDTDYREFAQGILLNEYNPNRINVTYNTFLGFAYYHSTITIEAADVFTDVVRDILNKKIEDNQILNKVYLVALERVDPTIESFSLSKNNYSQMINIIFTGDYEFRYSKEWLGALFKFDSSANYLVTIFYLLYNENLKKNRFALFIEELSDYLTTYKQKLSLRGMNYKLNHEELNNFDLLKKMFLKLMETDKIENDIFYLDGIKSILPLLSLDDRRNVLQHIQKQNNCPPPEIEELQRIIVN
ncbi:TPA: hypothetical protein VZ138_000016 [Streptococcus pneumoniae]|uniref:SIR2 family protein n=1 Tax=Streptococcus pneumoniae TaxID=1313 RepID=UPI0010241CB9|nr:SIR2 family protein [Streptococcus pneumoniae]MDY6755651.1 hypothetical protein [Streptococcus pneumoniae]VFH77915.1 membrane protein [Streptococcus pneumoniae]VMU70206.1 membrane protein [Streptococcus pneumoniae]HEV6998508.1 hypothetical protein [Streptococcus pneumoniae]HEV7537120.1 hypothetical protein [Streptococcus pneumoniae]